MSDEQYVAFLKALRDHFTKPIYHYTTAKGFRGIVDSSEIWLTNATFVNDTTECRAFWDSAAQGLLADERLSNMAARRELSSRLKDQSRNDTVYVASFSSVENSLQQYRAYGGFCIGFDPCQMFKWRYNLYQCVYDKSDIIDWVCSKAELAEWNGGFVEEVDGLFAADHLVFAAAVKYKDAAYRDEREVRMIAVSGHARDWNAVATPTVRAIHADDPPIHFRDHSSYGMPIPYVKFFISGEEFKEDPQEDPRGETMLQMRRRRLKEEEGMSRELLPITEVWIGPMAHQEEVRLAGEIMLREKGYENIPVIASQIPYRGG